MPDGFLPVESCTLGPLTIVDRWYVCVCIEFRQLSINDKGKTRVKQRERERERREMVERQSNVVYRCVCVCTRARNSSLHKHTHTHTCARIHSVFLLVRVCVCERAGVICFMMRRATCYTLTTIARSITWIFLSLNRHVDDRARAGEREREKRRNWQKKNERFNSSIRDEHGFCSPCFYICFFFLLSLSLSLFQPSLSLRCLFISFRSSIFAILFLFSLPSVLVLTFPQWIISSSVSLPTVKSVSFLILMSNLCILFRSRNQWQRPQLNRPWAISSIEKQVNPWHFSSKDTLFFSP